MGLLRFSCGWGEAVTCLMIVLGKTRKLDFRRNERRWTLRVNGDFPAQIAPAELSGSVTESTGDRIQTGGR